jgi:hypothetical protein
LSALVPGYISPGFAIANLSCVPLNDMGAYDRIVIITDHTDYDYGRITKEVYP